MLYIFIFFISRMFKFFFAGKKLKAATERKTYNQYSSSTLWAACVLIFLPSLLLLPRIKQFVFCCHVLYSFIHIQQFDIDCRDNSVIVIICHYSGFLNQ